VSSSASALDSRAISTYRVLRTAFRLVS
jgi:hypothetical protein